MNAQARLTALTPRIRKLLITAFSKLSAQGKSSPVHVSEDGTVSAVGAMMTISPDTAYNTVPVRSNNAMQPIISRFLGFQPTTEEYTALVDAQNINDALLAADDFFVRKMYNLIKNAYGYDFAEDCRIAMKMSLPQCVG